MAKKIYFIEDEEPDYTLIKEKLSSFDILPKENSPQYEEIHMYLDNPTKENKKRVIDFILTNDINIVLLDIELWGHDYGGKYLYERIISQENKLNNIIVIYLTKTTLQSQLTLSKLTAYVEKRYNSKGFDVESTVERIKDEIEKLWLIRSSNSQWNIDNM